MALGTGIQNFTDGSVTLSDATLITPLTTGAINYCNGDFSASGLAERWNEVSAYESRGAFTGLRHTTRTYPSGSFSVQLSEFTNAAAGNPIDAVLRNNYYAAAVSTLGTGTGLPYTLDLTFAVAGTVIGNANSTVTFTKCRITVDIAEGDPDSVTFNWTCYGTATGGLAPTAP